MSKWAATRIASLRSSRHVHGKNGGCHTLMNTPVTSNSSFWRSAAATEESTPPERPTKTFVFFFVFLLVGDMLRNSSIVDMNFQIWYKEVGLNKDLYCFTALQGGCPAWHQSG